MSLQNKSYFENTGKVLYYITLSNYTGWSYCNSRYYSGYTFVVVAQKNITNFIDNLKLNSTNQFNTLFFDKSSTFPRTALTDTNIKRCIKPDKADAIVIDSYDRITKLYNIEYVHILYDSDNDCYYAISIDHRFSARDSIRILKSFNAYKSSNLSVVHNGVSCCAFSPKTLCIYKAFIGEYTKPFITSEFLNQYLSKDLSDFSFDEYKSVISMLDSNNSDIQTLGFKSMSGYNSDKYYHSIRLMLLLHGGETVRVKSQNGVIVKNVLKTYNISRSFKDVLYIIKYYSFGDKLPTNEDKELFKAIANFELDLIAKNLSSQIQSTSDKSIKINVKYSIEYNE